MNVVDVRRLEGGNIFEPIPKCASIGIGAYGKRKSNDVVYKVVD